MDILPIAKISSDKVFYDAVERGYIALAPPLDNKKDNAIYSIDLSKLRAMDDYYIEPIYTRPYQFLKRAFFFLYLLIHRLRGDLASSTKIPYLEEFETTTKPKVLIPF